MNEPIAVEVRFEANGTLRPIAFEWKGKRFIIASHGRRWEKDGVQHILVMTTEEHVFELAYLQDENRWKLMRSPQELNRHSIV